MKIVISRGVLYSRKYGVFGSRYNVANNQRKTEKARCKYYDHVRKNSVKIQTSRKFTSCRLVNSYGRFEGPYCSIFMVKKLFFQVTRVVLLLKTGGLLDTDDEGITLVRNVSIY